MQGKNPCTLCNGMVYNQNVIYMYMQQRRKNDQIIHSWQSSSVLPFVNRLRRIEPEGCLQVMYR